MKANPIHPGTSRPTIILIGLVAALTLFASFSVGPAAGLGSIAEARGSIRDVPATPTPDTRTISAKALTNHECNNDEWHFVITQVVDEAHAPESIDVSWANGSSETVPLDRFTGHVAHYTTDSNLDSTVTSATAEIYSSWRGQFNLSHGPCGGGTTNTPVPTSTPTPPVANTPTNTNTSVPTATDTAQPTNTPVPSDTPVPTNTPTSIPTATPTLPNTATATPTRTYTAVPTVPPTNTTAPTYTATSTPLAPTPQETATPSNTPQIQPTDTPTQVSGGGGPEATPTPQSVAPPAPVPPTTAPAAPPAVAPPVSAPGGPPIEAPVAQSSPLVGGPPTAGPTSEVLPSTGVSLDVLTLAFILAALGVLVMGTGIYMRKRRA